MWKLSVRWLSTALLILVSTASAQTPLPQETRNAALRYWLAFADMQDPPTDKDTSALLEKTAAGEVPWDEGKLGSILDKNESAILRMQRATKLPECDWGLEYSDGPTASIAYAPKARVLARLNTLYGVRQAANGNQQAAVEAWLAGIRFSQHVAQGGSLIFALIAKSSLLPDFHAITLAAESGKLSPAERNQVLEVVHALPEAVFDWGGALQLEENGIELGARQIARATKPAERYAELLGIPAPAGFVAPAAPDLAAFHKLMVSAEKAFRQTPEQTKNNLADLNDALKTLHPFFQQTTPSFTRINDAREGIAVERRRLLQALTDSNNP
jgi:hypothetical protein